MDPMALEQMRLNEPSLTPQEMGNRATPVSDARSIQARAYRRANLIAVALVASISGMIYANVVMRYIIACARRELNVPHEA